MWARQETDGPTLLFKTLLLQIGLVAPFFLITFMLPKKTMDDFEFAH